MRNYKPVSRSEQLKTAYFVFLASEGKKETYTHRDIYEKTKKKGIYASYSPSIVLRHYTLNYVTEKKNTQSKQKGC